MPTLQITLPDGSHVSYELADETITIGRLDDNSIQIDDTSVSSHHAQLTLSGGDYHLNDLNSTNGTRVNGQSISEKQLHDGYKIRFGQVEVLYNSEIKHSDEKLDLPEAAPVALAPAASSHKPADFGSSAPFNVVKKKADPAGKAVMIVALVSILAFLGAVAFILTQQPALQ
jgi:pSer/pThr/pTyr-binding forkhead associated (FHA) protein